MPKKTRKKKGGKKKKGKKGKEKKGKSKKGGVGVRKKQKKQKGENPWNLLTSRKMNLTVESGAKDVVFLEFESLISSALKMFNSAAFSVLPFVETVESYFEKFRERSINVFENILVSKKNIGNKWGYLVARRMILNLLEEMGLVKIHKFDCPNSQNFWEFIAIETPYLIVASQEIFSEISRFLGTKIIEGFDKMYQMFVLSVTKHKIDLTTFESLVFMSNSVLGLIYRLPRSKTDDLRKIYQNLWGDMGKLAVNSKKVAHSNDISSKREEFFRKIVDEHGKNASVMELCTKILHITYKKQIEDGEFPVDISEEKLEKLIRSFELSISIKNCLALKDRIVKLDSENNIEDKDTIEKFICDLYELIYRFFSDGAKVLGFFGEGIKNHLDLFDCRLFMFLYHHYEDLFKDKNVVDSKVDIVRETKRSLYSIKHQLIDKFIPQYDVVSKSKLEPDIIKKGRKFEEIFHWHIKRRLDDEFLKTKGKTMFQLKKFEKYANSFRNKKKIIVIGDGEKESARVNVGYYHKMLLRIPKSLEEMKKMKTCKKYRKALYILKSIISDVIAIYEVMGAPIERFIIFLFHERIKIYQELLVEDSSEKDQVQWRIFELFLMINRMLEKIDEVIEEDSGRSLPLEEEITKIEDRYFHGGIGTIRNNLRKLIGEWKQDDILTYQIENIREHGTIVHHQEMLRLGDVWNDVDFRKFKKKIGFIPDEWQKKVLEHIKSNENVVVCAPTSSGKTFISFMLMEQVLRKSNDGVVVFVSPTKALVNQKNRDDLLGVFTAIDKMNVLTCQVLITVPQCLHILLLSPNKQHKEWRERIRYIIFDEVHQVSQFQGGEVWEQSLLLCNCPILALSATIGNPRKFVSWLSSARDEKVNLVEFDERPVDLVYYSYSSKTNEMTEIHPYTFFLKK